MYSFMLNKTPQELAEIEKYITDNPSGFMEWLSQNPAEALEIGQYIMKCVENRTWVAPFLKPIDTKEMQ